MKKTFTSAKEIFHFIIASLKNYETGEARTIAFMILDYFHIKKVDVHSIKEINFSEGDKLNEIIERLNNWEPIQYILEKADFLDREFYVSSSVLIPRPETEELVNLIVQENKDKKDLRVLDIGTGSGCIAISIAKEIKNSNVFALDKSKDALDVAEKNAINNQAQITFIHSDILIEEGKNIPVFDIIVSNPPYVMNSEKNLMRSNVTDFEPSLALFVTDEDPLIFYSKILDFSKTKLSIGGHCYFEINEAFGNEIKELMAQKGFSKIVIHRDIHEKDRFVSGEKTF